ncbi:L-ornithine N(alpha)-acyltransferase [Halovulum sp. GXIMD14793]
MKYDKSRLSVRLATSEEEVRGAQRLRYKIFVEEMGAKAAEADHDARLEKDRFDAVFDHLILINKDIDDPLDRVVGAYRLLPDAKAKAHFGFYGTSEYDLSLIENLGRNSVELGRSCIAEEHRRGAAMHLLWNGLAEYVLKRKIEVMFGVASFHGTDPDAISQALSYLHHNHLAPADLRVRALGDLAVSMDRLPVDQIDNPTAMKQIPSLIKAYLRLGGFVGQDAYIDHDFNTIDVCLLMDTTRMVSRYLDYYSKQAD